MKKKIFRWVKVLVLLYSIIGIAIYYLQDKLLFHPVAVEGHVKYNFDQPFSEVNLTYNKETNLNVIQFKAIPIDSGHAMASSDSLARGVVLYFHGNKENVRRYAPYSADFTHKGYEVWMMDYPGFGKSTGKFSEENLYKYAMVLYKLARSRWSPDHIIIYGKSLGTGVAAQLAAVRDCRRLILECPYYSMTSLARHYAFIYPIGSMLHYRFPTYEYLPSVTAPITIFHGTADGVVSYGNASRLKALLKPGDEFVTIGGGGHNDLHNYPMFIQKLEEAISR